MSESHPSRYRHLLPGPMRGGPPDPPPPRMAVPKRSMVKVACDACRQRKAKVSIQTIQPSANQLAAIKRKYDELQERMIDHEKLYDTLSARQPEEVKEILRRIQAGGDVKSVTEEIQEGDLLLELTSSPAFIPQQLPARNVLSHQAVPYGPLAGDPQAQLPVREGPISFGQCRITSPYDHAEHIFEEAWRETQYRTIFEEDLKSLDPSSPSSSPPDMLLFCSPFLANALLAVSCLYTKNQATFHVPGDPNSRGKAFAIEAARLLALEDTSPSLPVAQGLALIYVYEGALGGGGTALSYHSRMQARYLTLRLDSVPRSADAAIAGWFPYPVSVVPQNALKREIFNAECNLAEITEQILDFLIPLEEGWPPRRNPHRALELYTKLTRWKLSLPERLKVENAVLPSAILLHLNVELLIISILRPFNGLTKEEFGPFDPVTMSYAHASNAMWVVWHFRALYTLRNEHWMIQAASICAFRVLSDIETSTIQLKTFAKACQALIELGESFPVAKEVMLPIKLSHKPALTTISQRSDDDV
ncbi:Nitrogen assimilation transcription factor nit-4 [Fusarium oxysporum f. sp. conglutinans]|nr:Nitrogen assimilation transcription factor nit-4 [Fusarium oxysporum f. sp. conglutinans]